MPKRINAGTDVAMVGLWSPEPVGEVLKNGEQLDADVREGKIFFVNTAADGNYHPR